MPTITRCLSLIAGIVLFSPPSFAEVKSANEQGFHLEITQPVEASAEVAFAHFTNNIGNWWLSSHTWFGDAKNLSIDLKAGGCFCEINGAQQAEHMRVSFVDPGKRLQLIGGLGPLQGLGLSGTMVIVFSENEVKLTYVVDGFPTIDFVEFAPIVDGVLRQQLSAFSDYMKSNARG